MGGLKLQLISCLETPLCVGDTSFTSSLLPFRFPVALQQLASHGQQRASAFSFPTRVPWSPRQWYEAGFRELESRSLLEAGRQRCLAGGGGREVVGDDFSH